MPSIPVASIVMPTASAVPSQRTSARSPAAADCEPRALLLTCECLGVKTSLETLHTAAGTSRQGTSLAGLAAAAKTMGVKAEGVQVSREALREIETPALAYVNGNHFVALLAVQGSGESATATIHDPNSPREETIPQERLLRLCSGYLLLLHK